MAATEDTILVFTARSPDRIVREGGSQAWKLDDARARRCTWLVCSQNRHHSDDSFSDASEPHGAGFLIGRISAVRPVDDRWMVAISEFARIKVPDAWDHGRNPVRYTSLKQLGIDAAKLKFQPMPEVDGATPSAGLTGSKVAPERAMAEAKRWLAGVFGVKPDAIEITIRG